MAVWRKQGCLAICLIALALWGGSSAGAQSSGRPFERVLIESAKPYDAVIASIIAMGGRVTHQYRYVDGIAAEIPVDALNRVRAQIGSAPMYKDVYVPVPSSAPARKAHTLHAGPVYSSHGEGAPLVGGAVAAYAANYPGAYTLNFAGERLERVHARGYTGAGTIVATIDTGLRPGFAGLDNSILGGEDFVGDGQGYSNQNNAPHGTFVAGMISNNATFHINGALKTAVMAYAPGALNNGSIALLGSAPESKLYMLRVFGADDSQGAPVSVILEAMQRVIDLRLAYNRGAAGGLKIDVCNMSFGVMTLNAGRGLLDRTADVMLTAGIVPVAAVGNAGSATLTLASPASSKSTLAVGSASPAANDRIGYEVTTPDAPGTGLLFRPFSGMETAFFSSRGPNADGRPGLDVVATGVFNFSQGYCSGTPYSTCRNEVSLDSGTSYSAPIASGIAALLRQAFPHASATEIRNAIALTGRAGQLQDGSEVLDRGAGLIDALGAFQLLADGDAPGRLPYFPPPNSDVRQNVVNNTNLSVYSRNFRKTIANLLPGERTDMLFDVSPNTASLTVSVTNIRPQLRDPDQNQFFGDGVIVGIHSAKTSMIGSLGDYLAYDFPRSDSTYSVVDPDTGLLRVSIMGDYVNAGRVSATVTVTETLETLPRAIVRGKLRDGDTLSYPLTIPAGTHQAQFLLSWGDDWSHYPAADLDLILLSPTGAVNTDGATLAGPERVTVNNPTPGVWNILVDAFNIPAGSDTFKLRVLLDGVPQ